MAESTKELDPYLLQLVLSLQAGAMQQMGKIASPITGKIERDLTLAKHSIEILGMLSTKTAGNLSRDEKDFLDHVLYELRLNYVEEAKKSEVTETDSRKDEQTASEQEAPGGEETDRSSNQTQPENSTPRSDPEKGAG